MNKPDLDKLAELEPLNPIQLREYCYRDGCPTEWIRKPLTERELDSNRIQYTCLECDDKGWFYLKRQKERA